MQDLHTIVSGRSNTGFRGRKEGIPLSIFLLLLLELSIYEIKEWRNSLIGYYGTPPPGQQEFSARPRGGTRYPLPGSSRYDRGAMALIDTPKTAANSRSFRSRWPDDELRDLLDHYLETGVFPPGWDEEEGHRALALAQKKWPQDFEDYLTAEGVSDALVARAHRDGLVSSDAKAKQRAAETVHKLRGRMISDENPFKRGIEAAIEIARIMKGEAPLPTTVIDVPPALPEGDELEP